MRRYTRSPVDSARLAADIGASYYHPDGLSGLDCGTVVDFGRLFKEHGQSPSDELMKALTIRDTTGLVRYAIRNNLVEP